MFILQYDNHFCLDINMQEDCTQFLFLASSSAAFKLYMIMIVYCVMKLLSGH